MNAVVTAILALLVMGAAAALLAGAFFVADAIRDAYIDWYWRRYWRRRREARRRA